MMRWKILAHRIGGPEGQCRDCGQFSAYSAPRSCPRCALERLEDEGYPVLVNPVAAFVAGYEQWRVVAGDLTRGIIKSGSFYIYVGHDDDDVLELPMGDLDSGDWRQEDYRLAHELALALTDRYRRSWVVTTVGCWNPQRPSPR